MDPILQAIKDDIQADITSKILPGADPTKVLATDEANIMNATIDAIAELVTPPDTNFEEYDPAKVYSNALPDYVSFEGNIYKYINPTPSAGATPDESPSYWELSSSGAFSHQQNTDQFTVNSTFEIGKQTGSYPPGSEPPGYYAGDTVVIWAGWFAGKRAAIRHHYAAAPPAEVEINQLQFTLEYTGTGSDVWHTFASGEDVAALDSRVLDLETFAITASDELLLKANKAIAIVSPVANYTLVLSDASNMVRMNMGTANTVTIPPESSVNFPVGSQIVLAQAGTGQTTVQGGSGVTVNSYAGKFKTAGQYAGVTMIKVGANAWVIYGNLSS